MFARLAYGLLLLVVIWRNFEFLSRNGSSDEFLINDMSNFAMLTFSSFGIAQSVTLLLLTPALVAGVISDEKRRKTLHYLLASRLTSAEIVLGKLFARLLHVGVFIAIGLPVVSLLSLFGGIDPQIVLAFFVCTLLTVFALAAVSIFISTVTKRPRDAILAVFLLEAVWLILPPLIEYAIPKEWPYMYDFLRPLNRPFLGTHPAFPLISMGPLFGPNVSEYWHPEPLHALFWFVGLQVSFGSVCVLLAIWRVRKTEQGRVGNRGAFDALSCCGRP